MKLSKNPIITIGLAFLIIYLLPNEVVEAAGKVSEGSAIAGVPLEGLTLEEAKQRLESKVEEWQREDPVIAVSEYESIAIPRNLFQFDIDAAIKQLDERTKRDWSTFFMKQKNVQLPLDVSIANDAIDWPAHVDVEKTLANAQLIASNLEESNITIKYIDGAVIEQSALAEITFSIPEASNAAINYLIEELDGLTIEAESELSFLDTITLPNGMDNSEVEMSFVASGLYALVLQTNVEIIERHQQEKVTSYAASGLDAEVNRAEEKNLLLYNPNAYAYTVHASVEDGQMIMSIHSFPEEIRYTYEFENKVEVEPRTLYRYNPDFDLGEEEVVQHGEAGVQIEVYRNELAEDGSINEHVLISRDFYFPTPEIIEVSTEVVIPEEDVTTETVVAIEESTTIPQLSLGSLTPELVPSANPECTTDQVQCEESETDPSTLLLACMMENETESVTTEPLQEADVATEEAENNPYCDLMYLYLFLSLFGNEDIQAQTEETESLIQGEEIPAGAVIEEEVQ
ncbi:G5 domain-containing protein [Oceanobacillus chungangensis]|uniref:G5 domain-containing protein n=1 Tax=Oceanobacillus chungangensis TaxID=1229152 RepID=A0A3D8Q0J0_9BACI|nr:G5 domain-containing protein [Oceanobacillus chungangensis]RDW21562.1 hypothetical protein CWR45_01425 [Oceanobacillus chungangensis]